jgi:hypothetical protein
MNGLECYMYRRDLRREWHRATMRPWLFVGESEGRGLRWTVSGHGGARGGDSSKTDRGAGRGCSEQSDATRRACLASGLVAGGVGPAPRAPATGGFLIAETRRRVQRHFPARRLPAWRPARHTTARPAPLHHPQSHRRRHVANPRHV